MHTKMLLLVGCGITLVYTATPSSLKAQIAIRESDAQSSQSMPLSQQTLLEMRPTSSSLSSGSMEFLRFGKDVTVTPVENVKSAIDWLSGATTANQPETKATPDQVFDRTIANFKEQQKLELGGSMLFLEKQNTRN